MDKYGIRRAFVITLMAIMMILPVLSVSAAGVGEDDISVDTSYTVKGRIFSPSLNYAIERQDDLEVIIQFRDTVTTRDIAHLQAVGMDVRHVFHVIPAVYATGSRDSVLMLKHVPGVKWVENNTRLQYMMEQSTTTINATKTWYSDIVDADGRVLGRIDGTGVTAVVLDSGIDAGHPDLDYGEKTIMNLKSDANFVWVDMENTDTSSGHGTHCAGTVAGNGDASGGARKGVAPGARLIGLSTGEAVAIINALGALEWVYDHSRPGRNPYNIRVVSNSWGTSGDFYDPQDSIAQVTEKLTYENNVVVVFAAGNDGGDGTGYQGDDGTTKPQTNPYANTPAAISVAALERDGSGVAEFSSRGLKGMNETYPDIGAPGVKIWSTAARRTLISTMTKQDFANVNPYYFAISGTSMATPHISGVVALLWQACPEMKVSYVHDDYSGNETEWWSNPNTRVHEAELILEASAQYIKPNGGDNGVPDNSTPGHWGMKTDFAQGYGLVDVQKAVGIALTLHELRTRDSDNDGVPDYPNVTVKDALDVYMGRGVRRKGLEYAETDTLYTTWHGEWTRFTNQSNKMNVWDTDESHYLYIPEEAKKLTVELTYNPLSTEDRLKVASINMVIDANGDGSPDWRQSEGSITEGRRVSELDLEGGSLASYKGSVWNFNVEGQGVGFGILDLLLQGPNKQYPEITVEYDVSVTLQLDTTKAKKGSETLANCSALEKEQLLDENVIEVKPYDYHAAYGQWELGEPSDEYAGGTYIVIPHDFYDKSRMEMAPSHEKAPAEEGMPLWPLVLLILVILAIAGYYLYGMKKKGKPLPWEKAEDDSKKEEAVIADEAEALSED